MSAIVAGKSCKLCGKEFWISFGHPEWFKKRSGEIWEGFKNFSATGYCPSCYVLDMAERKSMDGTAEGELIIAAMIADTLVAIQEGKP